MQMAPVNLIEAHSLSFLKVISVNIQENKILIFGIFWNCWSGGRLRGFIIIIIIIIIYYYYYYCYYFYYCYYYYYRYVLLLFQQEIQRHGFKNIEKAFRNKKKLNKSLLP